MRRRRLGFTLIELLVVIAILAVLMALLLPAIQRVREAANKLHCGNNLRQLAISAHNYHNGHEAFPSGWWGNQGSQKDKISTWHLEVLPYLEQDNLYKNVITYIDPQTKDWGRNSGESWSYLKYTWYNRKALVQIVPTFVCPTDAIPTPPIIEEWSTWISETPEGEVDDPEYGPRLKWSISSYFGNGGSESYSPEPSEDGIFHRKSAVNMVTDVADGLSNTILFGERTTVDPGWRTVYANFPIHLNSKWGYPHYVDQILSSQAPINYEYETTDPSAHPVAENYRDVAAEMAYWRGIDPPSPADRYVLRLSCYGSQHPGGANFVFTDGSFRFLAEEMPLNVLKMLSTRAGNEILPEGY